MGKLFTPANLNSGFNTTNTLNTNFTAIEDALDNCLARDGSTPNTMSASLDLNSNDIINGGTANFSKLLIDGQEVPNLQDVQDLRDEAENWANNPYNDLVPEGDGVDDYSSKHFSAVSENWATYTIGSPVPEGNGSEYSSRHWADKSNQWAETAEDTEVEVGEYSAYHWAQKAESSSLLYPFIAHISHFGSPSGDGITNDYDAFLAASNWLKGEKYRRVYLDGNSTYYLNFDSGSDGDLFFSGFIGNGASVVIDQGGFLSYDSGASSNEFFLESLSLYKVGDRDDSTLNESSSLFVEQEDTSLERIRIRDCNFYGITSSSDLSSWSDDSGESRFGRLFRGEAKDSVITNIGIYGIATGIILVPVEGGVHIEENIIGRNVQTLFRLFDSGRTDSFSYGRTKELAIYNTATQKSYWIGKDDPSNPRGISGMDVLLLRAEHTEYDISNISGHNVIERNVYNLRGNVNLDNIYSIDSGSCVNIKNNPTDNQQGRVTLNNSSEIVGEESGAGAYTLKNIKDLILNNFNIKGRTKFSRPLVNGFDINCEDISFNKGYVEDLGSLISLTEGADSSPSSDITFSDIHLKNTHNSISGKGTVVDLSSSYISNLTLKNIKNTVDSPSSSKFADSCYYIENVSGILLEDVDGWGRSNPFRMPGSSDIKVKNSVFNIASDSGISTIINNIKSESNFIANEFDFWCNIPINTDSNPRIEASIYFKSLDQSTPVQCWDYWTEAIFVLDIPSNNSYFASLPITDKSFDLYSSFDSSSLLLSIDSSSGSSTEIRNRGSSLSHTDNNLHRVYNNGTDVIVRTDSTSLSGGTMIIKCIR